MSLRQSLRYASDVVAVLAAEFPDLADPVVAQVTTAAIAAQHASPCPEFEVILDSQSLANWRLRAVRDAPGCVRVACFRAEPTRGDLEREDRLAKLVATMNQRRPR